MHSTEAGSAIGSVDGPLIVPPVIVLHILLIVRIDIFVILYRHPPTRPLLDSTMERADRAVHNNTTKIVVERRLSLLRWRIPACFCCIAETTDGLCQKNGNYP